MKVQDFLDSYYKVMQDMMGYHELFYRLASVGRPTISEEIPTAAIRFNREGDFLEFVFNPDFLEMLNWDEIKFICCHEMQHILRNHGARARDEKLNANIVNIAMDIVVNHSLIDDFNFLKGDIPNLMYGEDGQSGICLKDTVFKDNHAEIRNQDCFEYYYNEIAKISEKLEVQGVFSRPNGGALDSHEGLPSMSDKDMENLLGEALGDTDEGKELAKKIKEANEVDGPGGKMAGKGLSKTLLDTIHKHIKKRPKWSSIVSKIRKSKLARGMGDEYQWAKLDRRNQLMQHNFIMPSIATCDDVESKKWDLWMFVDVSGSCVHHFDRFIASARSIPTDVFNIRFHTFDTKVEHVDINTKSCRAGGGTSFNIIEDYINKHTVRKGKKYPNMVFVVTDGYGNNVEPKKPESWMWFITDDGIKDYVHQDSKSHMLSEFE